MEVDEEGWPGGAAVMTDGWTPRRGLRSSRIYENIHKLADVWWIVCGLALARSLWMLLFFYFSRHSCRYSLSVTCIQIHVPVTECHMWFDKGQEDATAGLNTL